MQGSAPPTGGDQHEQVVSAALDLICSSSEQTYTQFLASFTQLNPGQFLAEHTNQHPGSHLVPYIANTTKGLRSSPVLLVTVDISIC